MKVKVVLIILIMGLLQAGCDWHCKKDHVFTFSYPNDLSQREFKFDVDYSEVPVDNPWVEVNYTLSLNNCSDKDELILEIYTQFSSENEYHLDETYKIIPGENNTYKGDLLYREATDELLDAYKERNVKVLFKGLNSSCFNGEINIQTIFPMSGLSIKPSCPYGYEVD